MISPATSSRITSGFISIIDCNRRPSIKCLKPLWVDQKYLWNFQHSYMLSIQYHCNRIYWNCAFNVHNTMKKKNIYIYIYIFKWSKELHVADDVSFLFFLIVQFTSCSDLFCCYFRSLVIDKGQKIRNWTDLNHSNIWIHSMFSSRL